MTKTTYFRPAVLGLLLMLTAFGCASPSDSGTAAATAAPAGGSITPDTTTNVGGGGNAEGSDYWANEPGSSAPLTIDSLQVLSNYVASHPVNNPTNIRVYIDTVNNNGRYGGVVKIGYMDNGQLYSGNFGTQNPNGPGYNRVSYHNWYVNKVDADFNQWFSFGGKQVFHGFFQDAYGAIVIVVDGGLDLGDGGGASSLSGSVYFKNFKQAPAPQFQGGNGEQCWFLLPPSPYECGTFKQGERVITQSALYPTDGYTRLGTFQGIIKSRGFR